MQHYRHIYDHRINISAVGHQLEAMLLDCTFQGHQCLPSNFTLWTHGTYGNCYTIVIPTENYASLVGPTFGLALTLYAEDDEYVNMVTEATGFRVELHANAYTPFPEDAGFTISPGYLTSVGVKQRVISRKGLPYDGRDCSSDPNISHNPQVHNLYVKKWQRNLNKYNFEANYTNQVCAKSCYQIYMNEQCGCIDAASVTYDLMEDDIFDSIPVACDRLNESVENCVNAFTSQQLSACDQVCSQACHEQDFEARITSSMWPRPEFYKTIKPVWVARNPKIAHLDAEQARLQISRLQVYFRMMNFEEMDEQQSLTSYDLASNMGGTMGLYVGLSFLGILEFLDLAVKLLCPRRGDKPKIQSTSIPSATQTSEKSEIMSKWSFNNSPRAVKET